MTNASRDGNRVPTIQGVSNIDRETPTNIAVNPSTGAVLIDGPSLYSGLDPRFLKLDQTTPQTVINGMPNFEGGLKVPGTTIIGYTIDLSPVVYSTTNYYITGDAAVVFYFSPTTDFQLVNDDGLVKVPILIAGLSVTQPTIYMYLATIPALDNSNVTCFSDLNETDFLAFIQSIADPSATIDYHETAFTFNSTTKEYTNVTTLPVCPPSANTTWTDPSVISTVKGGFIVNPITANIDHSGDYDNQNAASYFKTKGKFRCGNGSLNTFTFPLATFDQLRATSSGYNDPAIAVIFSMETLYPDGSTGIDGNVFSIGLYGTNYIGGNNVDYTGSIRGLWATIASSDGMGTVSSAAAIYTGMSANGGIRTFTEFMSVYSTFENLTGGFSSITDAYQFRAGYLGDFISATNHYSFYAEDNQQSCDTSWGFYSKDNNNYIKRLYIGGTSVKPTEDLEVQEHIKFGGQLKSTIASGSAPFVVTSTTPVDNLSIGGNAGTVTNGVYTTDIGSTVQAYNSNLTTINQELTTTSSPSFTAVGATTFTGALSGNATTATTASNVTVGGITGLGTGVATALAVNVGTTGSPVVRDGSLGTPSSGTVTHLTGTASININGTVGATTPTTGKFTTLESTTTFASPLTVASTTKVDNLNADMVDGLHSTDIPNTVKIISLTAQTANVTTDIDECYEAGLYRVSYYLVATTADLTAGTVKFDIVYTDASGNQVINSSPVVLTTLGAFTQGSFFIQKITSELYYEVSHTGIFGTAQYNLYMTFEKLL